MVRTIKNPQDRRRDIVLAARQLFQAKGYDQVVMQDVMQCLGIAKGTIYHYFKSKEKLFEAVIEYIVDEKIDEMKAILEESSASPLEKIKILIKAGNMSSENGIILDGLHSPGNEAMHVRLLATAINKQAKLYAALIQDGCKEGIFHTETPLEAAEFILSGIQFLTDKGIYRWSSHDITRREKSFPSLVERILNAPQDTFNFLYNEFKNN